MKDVILLEFSDTISTPQLGPLSLSSYIKNNGHTTDYFNMSIELYRFLSNTNILKQIYKQKSPIKTKSIKEKILLKLFSKQLSDLEKDSKINKILLIQCIIFQNSYLSYNLFNSKNIFKKIQGMFISWLIESAGFTALQTKLFKNTEFTSFVNNLVKNSKLIAFSVNSNNQHKISNLFAQYIHSSFPEKIIIMGGSSITYNFRSNKIKLSDFKNVKYFIINEGEEALSGIIKTINNDLSIKNVPNLIYKKDQKILTTKQEFTKDLNKLPEPDYNIFFQKYEDQKQLEKSILLVQSKGCKWGQCIFCNSSHTKNINPYREVKVPVLIGQIKRTIQKTGITKFKFINEYMTAKYANELSEGLIKQKIKINWMTLVRIEKDWTPQTIEKCKSAGCYKFNTSLEVGSQKINDMIQKGVNIKRASVFIRECKKQGIKIHLNTIVGFPMETYSQTLKTYLFIFKNIKNLEGTRISIFYPIKHTKICEENSKYNIPNINEHSFIKIKSPKYFFKFIVTLTSILCCNMYISLRYPKFNFVSFVD